MKRLILLGLLLLAVITCAASKTGALGYVNVEITKKYAWNEAKRILGTEVCNNAFATRFPQFGKEADYQGTFIDDVKIHTVEWVLPAPFAIGATDCDVSIDTFILAEGYIGWTKRELLVEVLIHEYVHLLSCGEVQDICGKQADCSKEFMERQEKLAYMVSRTCVGRKTAQ